MTADATLTSLLDAARARISESREQSEAVWAQVLANSQVAEAAPRVWACSEFIATSCSRHPSLLLALIENGRLFDSATSEWLAQDLVAHERGQSEAELMEALRHFRRRHMVRIAWRDIAGWADLDETLRDLSALADVCIQFA